MHTTFSFCLNLFICFRRWLWNKQAWKISACAGNSTIESWRPTAAKLVRNSCESPSYHLAPSLGELHLINFNLITNISIDLSCEGVES
jgi:hypothetical protein